MSNIKVEKNGLLIVPGHAIYQNGKWYGGCQNEEKVYEQHVYDGFKLLDSEIYSDLILSGGFTRPELKLNEFKAITNTEAEGMIEFARDAGLYKGQSNIYIEQFARDSFENIFFSMLCFYNKNQRWPKHVGVISWKFKAIKFYLIACGLNLCEGRFFFYGSGDLDTQEKIEFATISNIKYDSAIVNVKSDFSIIDPLHRNSKLFKEKRKKRMPYNIKNNNEYLKLVKKAYDIDFDINTAQQGIVGTLIDIIESTKPGQYWRQLKWPW